ncbi:SusC/RagA family TonB-linked outer membrane protein [Aureibacter tunicatorum]|uniref:TonB-linked SusC/RagA family outer membrane protein n=1 Tax=Aureibacter tunicatorum TaxID=866807 RepID=A0AAE3XSN0_9BACT|nr:TonB-dependent receptor [Aureibacter tunicatorum]MDR6241760.1 TonB-linked SusC/RagA family outer membrane protein [Aureibacter tunicatorum]BDD07379.1 SusC/RagA family TonB-linked outer membrane protein [Aureibacter tunicatorum]
MKKKKIVIKIAFLVLLSMFQLIMGTNDVQAQALRTVTGTVLDENGEGLPGCNIRIKGTDEGTLTDYNGNYTLENVRESNVLIFTFVGYEKETREVGSQSVINVSMQLNVEQLDEIVVIGYGEQKQRDVTGSVGTVKMEKIGDIVSTSFDQAIQGRIAGVQLTSPEGGPGEPMRFEIRGGTSITGNNDPLFVIDGIPIDDPSIVTTIPQADIVQIDILKDASATAIYGARGANGVVIITTRSGTKGKNISFNSKVGFSHIPNSVRYDVLSPSDFVALQKEIISKKGDGTVDRWGDPSDYAGMPAYDWQDAVMRTAPFQDYSITMNGGNDQTKYYASLGMTDQKGTLIGTSFQRVTGSLKLDQKINERLDVNLKTTYTYTNYIGPRVSESQSSGIIRSAIQYRPVIPLPRPGDEDDEEWDEDGGLDPNELPANMYSPVKNLNNTDQKRPKSQILVSGFLNYKILDNLVFRSTLGYNYYQDQTYLFYNKGTQKADKSADGISGSINNATAYRFTNENTLNYTLKINKHRMTALGGVSFQTDNRSTLYVKSNQFLTDDFGWNSIGLGTLPQIPQSGYLENALMSYFGRINYNYQSKYLATFTMRADGSSKFNEKNKFGYFPSFSLAWRAGDEQFVKNWNVFSDLKLKAGWGLTGNDRVNNTAGFRTIGLGDGYYFNGQYIPGASQDAMSNTQLKWESTSQFNVGLESGFLDNRILFNVEAYYKLTDNVLLSTQISPSTGFTSSFENMGSIANKGIEFSLNTVNVVTSDFAWETSMNISFNRNKLKSLSDGESYREYSNGHPDGWGTTNILQIGKPVGVFYGYVADGLYQNDDFIHDASTGELRVARGVPGVQTSMTNYSPQPGMPKYKDLDGDGVITENDRQIIGDPNPDFYGGINNTFRYKGFDLSVFMTFSYGNDIYNANMTNFYHPEFGRLNINYLAETANRWSPSNPIQNGPAEVPSVDNRWNQLYSGKMFNSSYIEDGSYLRIKNITLGYQLPQSLLSKLNINSLRVSATVDNLWVFSKYSGYDPEVSIRNGAMYKGIDNSAYPRSRTYTVGVNMNF